MAMFVSISGVPKRIIGIWVGVGGAWKKVRNLHVSVSSVYKRTFTAGAPVSPAGGSVSSTAYNGLANSSTLSVNSTGTITATTEGVDPINSITGQRWFSDLPDQTYEVMATLNSTFGTGYSSGTFNTWLALGNFSWTVGTFPNNNATRSATISLQFRRQSDGAIVSTSGGFNLSATTAKGAQP